jgi:hypothetical protein
VPPGCPAVVVAGTGGGVAGAFPGAKLRLSGGMAGRAQVNWTLFPIVIVSAMMSSDIAPGGSRMTVVSSASVMVVATHTAS